MEHFEWDFYDWPGMLSILDFYQGKGRKPLDADCEVDLIMDETKNTDAKDKVSLKDDAQSGRNLYAQVDDNRDEALALAKQAAAPGQVQNRFAPSAYSVIPPYVLQELATKNPANTDFLKTYNRTKDLQETPVIVRPRVDTNANGSREVYDAQAKEDHPGVRARFEGDKPHADKEVNDAYEGTGIVRDFYKNVLGRNSIDNQGMKFISTVNYGDNYENAFWNGSQMTYGRPGADSPFKTFVLLDVIGHEITHGVTEKESGMRYYGQSGALNESMSDVFGELIDQYSKKQTADQADWVVGNGIWKDGVNGRGLRDMLNPGTAYDDPKVGKDPQPAHMKDYWNGWGDNGGVHYNSGIPNRAFALFAKSVGGYAWESPAQIWYAALKNAGSNPNFASFAAETIKQAKALGKNDLVEKLEKSWDAVGVTPNANATDNTPGGDDANDNDHGHDHKNDSPIPRPNKKAS